MRESNLNREEALELLKKYNQEEFHIRHALTVEAVLRYFAEEYAAEELEYWGMVGLLHDIDFEQWPDEHCSKAPELLREAGVGEDMIRSIVSHAYGICSDVEPQEQMEKILFAADELSGLMGAAVLMRPSKSFQDMKVSSVKKKFKDKRFAAGCSRETISEGAERLGWTLDELLEKTLAAMKATEQWIESEVAQHS
ncbi:MAG: hydrolase [Eubacteriales bacterium]|nr:hydrolase [Eubacteriales bacterium]MDD4541936.1 hydrolase [Eubacteriales bacterium]